MIKRSLSTLPYLVVGAVMVLVHLVLAMHDAASIDGFFRADRAPQRFHAMRAVISAAREGECLIPVLVRQGNIGDYGLHALLYSAGGPAAVIALQTLLAVAAALCVVYLALRTFGSRRLAVAAGLLYGLLPQSLAFPHQLLSESISNPLLVFGAAGVVVALERPGRWLAWLLAGSSLGLAGLVRPALILVPCLASGLLIAIDRSTARRPQAAVLLAAGLAPFVAWSLFMLAQTGKFGPGESHQDLGINLSQSTAKVLLSEGLAPAGGGSPNGLPERLTLGQYAHYVATYPGGFLNLYFKNAAVLIADSGIGRLYVDLLGLGAEQRLRLQDPEHGWRAELTNRGPLAMFREEWHVAPGTMIVGALGACVFALVNLGMIAAYVMLLRRGSPLRDVVQPVQRRWCLAFLLLLPPYVLATSEVVAYAPSRLRSQCEFAVALLACFGWAATCMLWQRKRVVA